MISFPRTLVYYCRFEMVFILIINLPVYRYHNVFKSIPQNIVSWLGTTILMPNYRLSRSVLQWMSVIHNHGVTLYFRFTVQCWHVFCFGFLVSLMCVWLENTSVLFICIHKWVKSIVFSLSINSDSGLEIVRD